MREMFDEKDFAIFEIAGLENRMAEIRTHIQPKFQQLDEYFVSELNSKLKKELPIHIAQHRRRTANAPDFTWSAMGGDKRGYKKYPHFTLGINGEYIVMWLSFIDNPQDEKEMAKAFLNEQKLFENLPKDFVMNGDHTVNTYEKVVTGDITKLLTRWHDVKKGEFQLGRVILKGDTILQNPKKATAYMLDTYLALIPFYQLAFEVKEK